jgi:chaperonin GroES
MSKQFFMPGETLTDADKAAIQELEAKQASERKELLDKRGLKESTVNFMDVNFEPFEDRILVYPDPVEEITAGGIYKAESAIEKEKPLLGTVIAVGPGKPGVNYLDRNRVQTNLQGIIDAGDRIYYGNYAGTEFTINGLKYLIMRFADCFGRIK